MADAVHSDAEIVKASGVSKSTVAITRKLNLFTLSRQCLDRRIGDFWTLAKEVKAWEQERNRIKASVWWEFSKEDAREKFLRHYLNIQN